MAAIASAQTTKPANKSPVSIEDLVKRLEAAESRIKELEAQIKTNKKASAQEESQQYSAGASLGTGYDDLGVLKEDKGKNDASSRSTEEVDKELKKVAKRFNWNPSLENFQIQGRIHLDAVSFLSDSPGAGFFAHPVPGLPNFGTDPENRVLFRRLRVTFRGDVIDDVFFKLDLEFADTDAEFRDVYLGFRGLPILGDLTFGNQKKPISLDQLNSSNINVLMERPLIANAFQDESRRIGVRSSNRNDDKTMTWQVGFFNNEIIQNNGAYTSDAFQGVGVGRVTRLLYHDGAADPKDYLHLGLAGSIAAYDGDATAADGEANLALFRARPEIRTVNRFYDTGRIMGSDYGYQQAAELILNLGPLSIVGEHELDQITRTGFDDVFFHGGYVYVAYYLTGEHQPYNRRLGKLARMTPRENFFVAERLCGRSGGGWGAFQIIARYSYIDLTDNDVTGGVGHQFTAGLNWWWNNRSRLLVNYVYGDETQRGPIGGFSRGTFSALSTRFQVDW